MTITVCLDASQCVVNRLLPWTTLAVLRDTFDNFVGSGSIVQLIDGSHILKQRLERSQSYNKVVTNVALRNLCASQNRFSSHMKPLGRLVLLIGAIIEVHAHSSVVMGRCNLEDSGEVVRDSAAP